MTNAHPRVRSGSMHFASFKDAQKSGLAKQLFKIEGVTGVFFGSDFITVNKEAAVAWHALKPHIFGEITDYFASGVIIFFVGLNDEKQKNKKKIKTKNNKNFNNNNKIFFVTDAAKYHRKFNFLKKHTNRQAVAERWQRSVDGQHRHSRRRQRSRCNDQGAARDASTTCRAGRRWRYRLSRL